VPRGLLNADLLLMHDNAFIAKCLADLDAEGLRILNGVAEGERQADSETLGLLEGVAAQSARVAYGNNRPELLSVTMSRLIAWTDHCDDDEHVEAFKLALRTRPLPPPR
jgi:hypothetical protein